MRKLSKTLLIALGLVGPLAMVPILNANPDQQIKEIKNSQDSGRAYASTITLTDEQYGVPVELPGGYGDSFIVTKPVIIQNGLNDYTAVVEIDIINNSFNIYFGEQYNETAAELRSGVWFKFRNSSGDVVLRNYSQEVKVTEIDTGEDFTGKTVSGWDGRIRVEVSITEKVGGGITAGMEVESEMTFFLGTSTAQDRTHKVIGKSNFTEGETNIKPPQITTFTSQAITEGIKLDWIIDNPDGADITSIEIFYDGVSIHKPATNQLAGSFTHEGGERGKQYKLVVTTSDAEPLTTEATTSVKAEANPPSIISFADAAPEFASVDVYLKDNPDSNKESITYGEGRLVDSDGNIKSTVDIPRKQDGQYGYFFEQNYESFAGELFFEFTDTATNNIYTTNAADTSKKQMDLNGQNASVTFLEPADPATITVDNVEVKGENDVEITITNTLPSGNPDKEDTVINEIPKLTGTGITEGDNPAIVPEMSTADGTYTINVYGLTAGTTYSDWILTTQTNAGAVITEITSFTTIKPAAQPLVEISAAAKDQLSANVTYTITAPTGDPDTTDTTITSAKLSAEGTDYELTADGTEHTVTIEGLTADTDYTWTYTVESNAATVTGDVAVKTAPKADPVKGTSTFGITNITPSKTDVTLTYDLDLADETDTNVAAVITEATITGDGAPAVDVNTFAEGEDLTVNLGGLTGETSYNWDLTLKTNAGDVFEENISFETLGKDEALAASFTSASAESTGQTTVDLTYELNLPAEDATTQGTEVTKVIIEDEANGVKEEIKDPSKLVNGSNTVTLEGLEGETEYNFTLTAVDNAPGKDDATTSVTVKTDDKSPNTTGEPTVDYTTVTPGYTDATMGVTLDITEGNATTSDVVIKSAEAVVTDGTNNINGSTISVDEANMGVEQTVTFGGLAINTTYTGTLTVVYDNGSGTDQTETYDIEEFTTNDAVPTILTFESNITSTTSADIIYDIDVPDSTLLTINSATIDYTDINGNQTIDIVDEIATEGNTTMNVADLAAGEETEFTLNIDYTKAAATDSVQLAETISVVTPESTIGDAQLTDIKGGTATFVLEETFYIDNPKDDMIVTVNYTENGDHLEGTAKYVTTNNARGFRTHTYELDGLAASATYSKIEVEVTYKTDKPETITVEYEGVPISPGRPIITDDAADIAQPENNKKFPWWIIILLILITLASVGIALFFILRKKDDEPKETKQNKKAKA